MLKEPENTEFVWTAVYDTLEAKRRETFEALRAYPRQVAGCDTHFRYLAEQRAKISGELRQLEALRRDNPVGGIEEFIRDSVFVDESVLRGQ